MNSYPYPVLTATQSAYKNAQFELSNIECSVKNGVVNISLSIQLTSAIILNYLKEKKAKLLIKVSTDIITETCEFEFDSERIIISLDCEKLRSNDIIVVTAYIVAQDIIEYIWNEELMEYYPKEMLATVRKNDILAISNAIKYDYTTINADFIKISGSDEYSGKGLTIKLSNDNYIDVIVSNALNHAYAATKRDHKLSPIFSSHLVFETLVFVIVEVIQDKEQYSEKEWYRLFTNLLEATTGETIDEIVRKIKDDSIDMNQVFELANRLTNNQIEQSLIRASEEDRL